MILVTGATGHVGAAALRRLSRIGHAVAAMVRDPRKAEKKLPAEIPVRLADYDNRGSLERALSGITRLLFVASDGDARDVLRHHKNVIETAAACGVRSVIFTSIIDVEDRSPFLFRAGVP